MDGDRLSLRQAPVAGRPEHLGGHRHAGSGFLALRKLTRPRAGVRPVVKGLDHFSRPRKIFRRQRLVRSRPKKSFRAPAAGFRENCGAPCRNRAARRRWCGPRAPARDQRQQIAHGALVDGGKRFVEQDDGASWSIRRANSRRWVCPPDSAPIWRRSKPVRPTAASASRTFCASALLKPAEQPDAAPKTHGGHVEHVDGKAEVDLRRLRQIGDFFLFARAAAPNSIAPPIGLTHADQRLDEGGLARAIGAADGEQRAGRNGPVEVMHGGMAVVAEREVAQGDRRRESGQRPKHASPQQGHDDQREADASRGGQAQQGEARLARGEAAWA